MGEAFCLSVPDVSYDDNNDDGAISNNIIFTIKDTKLYVPDVTESAELQSRIIKTCQQKI